MNRNPQTSAQSWSGPPRGEPIDLARLEGMVVELNGWLRWRRTRRLAMVGAALLLAGSMPAAIWLVPSLVAPGPFVPPSGPPAMRTLPARQLTADLEPGTSEPSVLESAWADPPTGLRDEPLAWSGPESDSAVGRAKPSAAPASQSSLAEGAF
jgi:hypothetical protein